MKTKYMHTIDRQPGRYDGEQICFVGRRWPGALVDSLAQIRREREASVKFRKDNGFSVTDVEYGYILVKV